MATIKPKIEGTATTYGQRIVPINNKKAQSSTPLSSQNNAAGGTYQNTSVSVSNLVAPQSSFPQAFAMANTDTLVHVIQNSTGSIQAVFSSSLSLVTSKVAFAAANADKNPVIVPYGSILYDPNQEVGVTKSVLSNFTNISPIVDDYFLVKGSFLKSKPDQLSSLKNSQKVDSAFSLRTRLSDFIEMNFIKVPTLKANFLYNFFQEGEDNIVTQEDQSLDPLLSGSIQNVPMYVDITWDPTFVTQRLKGKEVDYAQNKQLRQQLFGTQGGVTGHNSSRFRNSIQKRKRDKNSIVRDGKTLTLTDIQNIEDGFNSICNDVEFASTISIVIETSNQPNNISSLPLTNPPLTSVQPQPSGVVAPVPSGIQSTTNTNSGGGIIHQPVPIKINTVR